MLTKDLIRFRVTKGEIKPRFLDPEDKSLLDQATALVSVFKAARGSTRMELEQESARLIEASPVEAAISRGLEKLLLDRTEFVTPSDDERPAYRNEVFAQAFDLLGSGEFESLESYVKAVEHSLDRPVAEIRADLFSDLPMYHPVGRFKALTPLKLIHLYNTAQVQWLLLHCRKLEVLLRSPGAAKMRQLFKNLRFQQLLAEIQKEDRGVTRLIISGPLSLFTRTRKYGMNLANFFPALLHMPSWVMTARVSPRVNTDLALNLTQDCGIEPQKQRFLAYVPREVEAVVGGLRRQLPDWEVDQGADFVPLPGEFYCFPDYTLRHKQGFTVALELFHPWHETHLKARLMQLRDTDETPLVLGVAAKVLKDKTTKALVEDSAYFQRAGLVFNEIPSSRQIAALVETLRTGTAAT
ncbi:MAG: DUF790 family protein [Acidobacteriota bacterium]|nr:DUF790 family protein [Acidobacteriota bacterium]